MPTPKQRAMYKRNMKWREEYEAGSTLRQIADRYDVVSLTAVSNAIEKVGGKMRPRGYVRGEKDKHKPKKGLIAWLNA